jgi:hypothetical protein
LVACEVEEVVRSAFIDESEEVDERSSVSEAVVSEVGLEECSNQRKTKLIQLSFSQFPSRKYIKS